MRVMIAFVFALVVAALVLMVSKPARQGAEKVLFAKGTAAGPAAAQAMPQETGAPQQADQVQNAGQKPGGGPAEASAGKAEGPSVAPATVTPPAAPPATAPQEQPGTPGVAASPTPVPKAAPPKRTEEPKPAAVPQQAPTPPAQPPVQQAGAGQRPPHTGTQQVTLPPALSLVSFGMSSARARAAYDMTWSKQEAGELMLVHYLTPDRNQMVRFHFSGDSLYLIEARIKPAAGQSLKELYDSLQAEYAARFLDVAESSQMQWSDGTVIARIETAGDSVQIVYTCPSAKRGG